MNAPPDRSREAPASQSYPLLDARQKYVGAFCTEDEIRIAEHLREFVDRELMPYRHDLEGGWHRDEQLARDTLHRLYAKLVDFGVTKTNLPTKYGGLGYSPIVRQMINEELSRADLGLGTLAGKIPWIVSLLTVAGREDLLESLMPRIAGNECWTACVCMTEPTGGVNVEDPQQEFGTVRLTARVDGEHWVLDGHKQWPGPSGEPARFRSEWMHGHLGYFSIARVERPAGGWEVGLFFVPAETPGLEFSRPYQKMGLCWTDSNSDIWYRDVRIPRACRVDTRPGQAAEIIYGYMIGLGRLSGAARLVGVAQAVLEIALGFTGERRIAGVPMRERSMFAGILAEMFRVIDVARQYYLSVTWQVMHADVHGTPWSPAMMAKFSAAHSCAGEAAELVINKGMELMGAAGYAYESQVEKYMRDYKILKMAPGGAQRDLLEIAQGLYGPYRWTGG
jgi:alkylation response protein AidB-like acyl-CoA dehydrogenase